MIGEPSIIRSNELAKRMGMSQSTLWRLAERNATLRGCAIDENKGRLWWSVARLRERGFLLPASTPAPATESTANVG